MLLKNFINGLKKLKIISLILVVIFLSACTNSSLDLKINDTLLDIEISADALSRVKGLSGREDLCENCGMVFLFGKQAKHFFWMKDMNFPLDIVYIQNDKIVEIFKDVQVLDNMNEITEIFPNQNADKVLELNAGWCETHNVQLGNKIEL
jgi:uncharacterized membrane protein (UPF0127 family)